MFNTINTNKKIDINIDNILVFSSIIYIVLPIIIFLYGFLKIYIAIPISILFILFSLRLFNITKDQNIDIINKKNITFWCVSIILLFLWVLLSGIGGICYQGIDFAFRNAMYWDITKYKWPIIYDFTNSSNQSVISIIGNEKVALSYYLGFFLVPAYISKILNLSLLSADKVLLVWSFIGVFLVFYLINRYFKKTSFIFLVLFILFGYLDKFVHYDEFFDHLAIIEPIKYLEYSTNTTNIFNVFNQAIPTWIIVLLFIDENISNNKKIIFALTSLSFIYSPFVTITFVIFDLYILFKDFKKCISIWNIIIPFCMLFIFGSFYQGLNSGVIKFPNFNLLFSKFIPILVFIVDKFLLYYILMRDKIFNYNFGKLNFILLLVLPFNILINGNLVMRCAIPCLFILCIYTMKYLIETPKSKSLQYYLLICLIVLGFTSPFNTIYRHIYYTFNNRIYNQFGGFYDMSNKSDYLIKLIDNQHFVHNYNNYFFYKYLAKE